MPGLLLVASSVFSLGCGEEELVDDAPAVFSLEEVARYGNSGDAGSALTMVAGVVATDTTVLVLEPDPARVAVFSHEGRWLRDLAGAGEGPGELRRPLHMGLVEGRLWVGDPYGARLEVFGSNERPIASYRWTVDPDSSGTRSVPIALLSDGTVFAGPGGLSVGQVVRGAIEHRTYLRASPDGEVIESLASETIDPDDFFQAQLASDGVVMGMHPHDVSPLVVPYPDGSGVVLVERPVAESGEGGAFRIRIIGSDGTEQLRRHVEYGPISADGAVERYLAEVEEDMVRDRGSADRGFIEGLRSGIVARRFFPPVTKAVTGTDGSIWIRREETVADSVSWQLFDRSGALLGRLPMPKAVDIVAGSEREVWAVELDAFDVPFVVRYRLGR